MDLLDFTAVGLPHTDFSKLLLKENPSNDIKSSALLCFLFCFFFLSWQSDRHVLSQIKGGPSGQKAIKMTCCERMQWGMWHCFYWHLFGCLPPLACWRKVNVSIRILSRWIVSKNKILFPECNISFVFGRFQSQLSHQHHISSNISCSCNRNMHLLWNCEVINHSAKKRKKKNRFSSIWQHNLDQLQSWPNLFWSAAFDGTTERCL